MLGCTLSAARLAQDMRSQDAGFAERLAQYEARHGKLAESGLAVAAQANYLCWFEAEFPRSLVAACAAIGSGRAGSINLCQQVSPARWLSLNQYPVAIGRWLGHARPLPPGMDAARVDSLAGLLGQRTPARAALARVYCAALVKDLMYSVTLSSLGPVDGPGAEYADCRTWYGDPATPFAPAEADLAAIRAESDGGEDVLAHLLVGGRDVSGPGAGCQPPCMQRYERYQYVRLAAIDALRWRANLPPDPRPRAYWAAACDDAAQAVPSWLAGTPATSPLAAEVHAAFGRRTPAEEGLVTIYLNQPPSSAAFYDWVRRAAAAAGCMAWQLCGWPEPAAPEAKQ